MDKEIINYISIKGMFENYFDDYIKKQRKRKMVICHIGSLMLI